MVDLWVAPSTSQNGLRILFFYLSSLFTLNYDPPVYLRKRSAPRILVTSWCILAFLLSTGYKACLTSLLKDVPLMSGVTDLESLRRFSKMHGMMAICLLNNPLLFLAFFGQVDLGVLTSFWPYCTATLYNSSVCYVYVVRESNSDNVRMIVPKEYIRSPEPLINFPAGPILMEYSEYRTDLSHVIKQSAEAGLYIRWKHLSDYKRKAEDDTNTSKKPLVSSLKLRNFRPVFIVWAFGILIAWIVLVAELSAIRIIQGIRIFAADDRALSITKCLLLFRVCRLLSYNR